MSLHNKIIHLFVTVNIKVNDFKNYRLYFFLLSGEVVIWVILRNIIINDTGKQMTVKIDDVAKLAGVSKTTVSRVLNKRGSLSEKTIKKVYDAMDELNYRPNVIARQLFKQETKLIGLIFPTVTSPFFGQLISSIQKQLFNQGYRVLIGDSKNDSRIERKYLQELLAHQVDGLIVGSHNSGIDEYNNPNMPIVAIDRRVNDDIPIISSNNYMGGLMATELLIKKGARKIIHTNDPKNLVGPPQN